MNLINQIFTTTLSKITPTACELSNIQLVVDEITKILYASEIPSEIMISFIEPQGSTGLKQTSLRDVADIDLFIGLDPDFIFQKHHP